MLNIFIKILHLVEKQNGVKSELFFFNLTYSKYMPDINISNHTNLFGNENQ